MEKSYFAIVLLVFFWDLGIFLGVLLQEMLEMSWCKERRLFCWGMKMEHPIVVEGGSPWKAPIPGDGAGNPAQNSACLIQASPMPWDHP